jgi:hypothetical protein
MLVVFTGTFLVQQPLPRSNNAGNPSISESSADRATVKVKSCVKVFIARGDPAYSLAYDYEFPGRAFVHVNGLGTIPGKGSYRYITRERTLEFRDASTGQILRQLPLGDTVIVAAKPPLTEVPPDNQFPSAYRSFVWDLPQSLKECANTVLGRYFRYYPHEDKDMTFLATTFTPLQLRGVPTGVLGQVALLLSFPYDPVTGKYSFHVQAIVREGRTLSDDFRPTSNPSIIRSADTFVDALIAEMKHSEKDEP